jgi:hypothetical protein
VCIISYCRLLVRLLLAGLTNNNNNNTTRWFLQHESALFKHRLQQLSSEEVARFTKANGLDFEVVSADEKARVAQQLQTVGLINASGATGSAGGGGAGGGGGGGGLMGGVVGFDSTTYYKIPFTQALDLVSKRQVCW